MWSTKRQHLNVARPSGTLALVFLLVVAFAQQAFAARLRPIDRATELPRVDALARDAVASGVPGLSVVILKGSSVWYAKGFGLADRERDIPATPLTPYQIGSITKQMTAAAIMRLEEQGRLRVEDSVRDYVPELDTRGRTITLHHLLTHTSGIANYTDLLTDAYVPMSEDEVIALINSRPLDFEPGTSWSYSNGGYYVLGLVIERVSGMTYPELLRRQLFEPLGLKETTYCGYDPLRAPPSGYYRDAGVTVPVAAIDMSLVFAAGGVCSTAVDLVRWSRALVSGRVVSPASYETMITPVRLSNGTTVEYGYGLVPAEYLGRKLVFHDGAVPGFTTSAMYFPEDDLTIVVLTNLTDPFRNVPVNLSLKIALELFTAP